MGKTLEFLFDVGSPTTYLAHKRMPGLIERTGAEVIYIPVLLGGIFKATGNASPVMVPAKGVYMGADMARYAKRFDITLNMNPHFPINTLPMMRMLAGLVGEDPFPQVVAGEVIGDLHVANKVEIQSQARIIGAINYVSLAMQAGATVSGQLCHRNAPAEVADQGPLLKLV